MKILVVTQYFWPENFKINDLCDALIERGHEVTVYTGLPNYPVGEFYPGYSFKGPYKERVKGINVIRVPLILRGKSKGIRLLLNYISFFLIATFLAPFLVKGRFDKIFVLGASPVTPIIPAIFLKWLKKAPIFFWVMDLWPHSLEATGVVTNKKILSLIERGVSVLYANSDKILVTSKGFIPQVLKLGVSEDKISYLPQWSEDQMLKKPDPHFFDPRIPVDGFKVMFAGNIGSAQSFETIVAAAKILKDHKNIFFLILGDGLMRSWAEKEVEKFLLKDNFIFLGRKPLETMVDYYSKADAMLMTLTDSALFAITVPAKLQGYLASSKPIIASINGEGAELVQEAKAGLSVPASNASSLAEAILTLSQKSKDDLSEMGKKGKRFYDEHFDREVLIDFLIQKLNETTYR